MIDHYNYNINLQSSCGAGYTIIRCGFFSQNLTHQRPASSDPMSWNVDETKSIYFV